MRFACAAWGGGHPSAKWMAISVLFGTLQAVDAAAPEEAIALCPDLLPPLADLDRHLMTKTPKDRPASAVRPAASVNPAALPVARPIPTGSGHFEPLDETWAARLADLTPKRRADAVVVELRRRNPAFSAQVEYEIRAAAIDILQTHESDGLTDLTPLRSLRMLTLHGNGPLSELSPLAELRSLTDLRVSGTAVADLSPLRGSSLTRPAAAGSLFPVSPFHHHLANRA